jgi:hypothetical protein
VNVSGVGTTPPPPPLPPVAPPQPATEAPTSGGQPRAGTGGRSAEQEHRATNASAHEPPPLRMITVTEMRVMLGQLPANAAFKLEQQHTDLSAAS